MATSDSQTADSQSSGFTKVRFAGSGIRPAARDSAVCESALLRICLLANLLWVLALPAQARYQAALIHDYPGRHQDEFITQYDRVRLLTRQAQLEVSTRLGLLQYREGFDSPLVIRFEDGAPEGLENSLAYVRLMQNGHQFVQELVINLDATAASPVDFDQIFYHEMTHAVMNDAVGGEASMKIPHWVQEGLAQYVSGEGENRVTQAARQFRKSQVHALLYDLDGPYAGFAYPQYYLAIAYLHEKHSVNAVQALVRDLILGKSITDAIEEATGQSWEKFQDEMRAYSLNVLEEKARPDY
jgi:hypothetical protein